MKDTTFDPRLNMCVSIVLVYIISVIYNVWDSQTTDSTSLFQGFFKGGLVVAAASAAKEVFLSGEWVPRCPSQNVLQKMSFVPKDVMTWYRWPIK